ncbi:unnamed protein product [Rhizophagus irregularis]|nr:unnamed protein product [Rhizophagus irregularis]CAB5297423.1 unnamed protein product [Rhizophagus irregularis]
MKSLPTKNACELRDLQLLVTKISPRNGNIYTVQQEIIKILSSRHHTSSTVGQVVESQLIGSHESWMPCAHVEVVRSWLRCMDANPSYLRIANQRLRHIIQEATQLTTEKQELENNISIADN